MKFIKGARTWRSISGTQTFFWPLTHPPPPPPRYSINQPLSKGLYIWTPAHFAPFLTFGGWTGPIPFWFLGPVVHFFSVICLMHRHPLCTQGGCSEGAGQGGGRQGQSKRDRGDRPGHPWRLLGPQGARALPADGGPCGPHPGPVAQGASGRS